MFDLYRSSSPPPLLRGSGRERLTPSPGTAPVELVSCVGAGYLRETSPGGAEDDLLEDELADGGMLDLETDRDAVAGPVFPLDSSQQ
jgi:hypothetical protein